MQYIKPKHIVVEKMPTNPMFNTVANMVHNTMPNTMSMDMTKIKNSMGLSGTCDTINAQSNVLPTGCMCLMNKSWQLMPNGMYSCQ
jgi:hypothetical protein